MSALHRQLADAPLAGAISRGVAPGVHVLSGEFDRLVHAIDAAVGALAADEPFEAIGIPPVIRRSVIERSGYLASFPHLLGTVQSFGDPTEERWREMMRLVRDGRDWSSLQDPTDVVLLPAACYYVYSLLEGQTLPADRRFTLLGHCYRHEHTDELGRLRSFRMREFVRVGDPDACRRWRDRWLWRVAGWFEGLGLHVEVEAATDPFFGAVAPLMQPAQAAQQLKWEVRAAVEDSDDQAIASCNCHLDHLTRAFEISTAAGEAHSACVAFGLERVALALIHVHGPDVAAWPTSVEEKLCTRN
jgi:seryl-tRNA synthetase